MKKKKFCLISPNFFKDVKGGTEIQTYNLGKELVRRKWKVYFIRENPEKRKSIETIDGMSVYSLKRSKSVLTWLNLVGLFRSMRKIRADFWYCRAARTYVFAVWLISKLLGGQVLWACSSDVYVAEELGKDTSVHFFSRFVLKLDRCLFIFALRKIAYVFLQTHTQKVLLKENWGIEGSVIRNGYPISEKEKTSRKPLVLWIGNLRKLKHPEEFIHLARALQDSKYEFRLIGKEMGFPSVTESVKEAHRSLDNFEYLGEQEQNVVHDHLRRARLVVHTGEYEGFSNVFIESWLFGVPVVSLFVDPDGLIVSQNVGRLSLSKDKMVSDVRELMEDSSLWDEISVNARRFAEEKFDIRKSVDLLLRTIGEED